MKKSKIDPSYNELQRRTVYLPEEIILKILTPLPAKSIGRCRCVSKQWRTLLSDPKFIERHLSQNNRQHKALSFHQGSVFLVDFHDSLASATELKKFEIPYSWMKYCCSYNGLVLAGDLSCSTLFLLNPATLECVEFPEPPGGTIDGLFSWFGIGYNKVVAIGGKGNGLTFVCTFGSDTSTNWTRLQIQNSPFDKFAFWGKDRNGVFCNGSIHWMGLKIDGGLSHLNNLIVAFDLIEEMFRVIPSPLPIEACWQWSTLGVVGGSLCVVYVEYSHGNYENHKVHVFVMNEYGVESSWTKLQFIHHCPDTKFRECPLFLGNDVFMLTSSGSKAVIYNVKEKSSRDIVISGLPFHSSRRPLDGYTMFVDSLVSPSQFIGRDRDKIIGLTKFVRLFCEEFPELNCLGNLVG